VVVPRREMLDAPYGFLEADFIRLLDRPRHQPASRKPGRAGRARVDRGV
jgi:hypothetical protein